MWLAEVPLAGLPHRQAHLALLLQRWFDVLYVEPAPPLRLPSLRVSRHSGVKLAQVVPLLNARPRVVRSALALPLVRKLAIWQATAQVLRAVRIGLSQPRKDELIVVCSNVFLGHAGLALKPRLLVLDVCDDPRYYPGEPFWTRELLTTMVHRAGLVTTSSRALQKELGPPFGPRPVELVANGVRASFLDNDRGVAQPPIGGPVGFVGYLGSWLDFVLLEHLASALPDIAFEFVGAIDPSVASAAASLARHANVRLIGPVPECDVPRTLARFSVGLIPFMSGPYTRAVNPNKLYEYAAWNLPIVTTPFSPDVAQFGADVDVCHTTAEFVRVVRDRQAGVGRRGTRWIGETHTWSATAERFVQLVARAAAAAGRPTRLGVP